MARAGAYDEWEDVGMAFTEEEVAEFSPHQWAEERQALICSHWLLLYRKLELPGIEKPHWHTKCRQVLRNVANWYAARVTGNGIDWEDVEATLPNRSTKEGKALTAAALALDPEMWIAERQADAEAFLRRFVTLARRAKLVKADVKFCNRFANAIMNERRAYDYLLEFFNASPVKASSKKKSQESEDE